MLGNSTRDLSLHYNNNFIEHVFYLLCFMDFHCGISRILYYLILLKNLEKCNKELLYGSQEIFVCYLYGELRLLLALFLFTCTCTRSAVNNNLELCFYHQIIQLIHSWKKDTQRIQCYIISSFNSLYKELFSGLKLVDNFSDYFSFHIVNCKDKNIKKANFHKLDKNLKDILSNSKTILSFLMLVLRTMLLY